MSLRQSSLRQSITDVGFRLMSSSHHAILRISHGKVLRTAFGMPVVELRTVGRKTGQSRTTVLAAPIHDASRVVLVASKGGDARDPQWYGNLKANPDVEILIEGETRKLRARTASEVEHAELWPQIVRAYEGYGGYQDKTTRTIPVVVCEPRPV
jgi:deazaflavin-dependent oxidoreductase (nitroreductase family)